MAFWLVAVLVLAGQRLCPRQDSNLRHRLRRAVLYPLSYGGSVTPKGYQLPLGVLLAQASVCKMADT